MRIMGFSRNTLFNSVFNSYNSVVYWGLWRIMGIMGIMENFRV